MIMSETFENNLALCRYQKQIDDRKQHIGKCNYSPIVSCRPRPYGILLVIKTRFHIISDEYVVMSNLILIKRARASVYIYMQMTILKQQQHTTEWQS